MKKSFFLLLFASALASSIAKAETTPITSIRMIHASDHEVVFLKGDPSTQVFQRVVKIMTASGYKKAFPTAEGVTDVWCEIRTARTESEIATSLCYQPGIGDSRISVARPYVLAASDGTAIPRFLGEIRNVVRSKVRSAAER